MDELEEDLLYLSYNMRDRKVEFKWHESLNVIIKALNISERDGSGTIRDEDG